jgi:hypothetical protein
LVGYRPIMNRFFNHRSRLDGHWVVRAAIVALTLLAIVTLATPPESAGAQTSCDYTGSWHVGSYTPAQSNAGSEASITLWNPAYCRATVAYSMIYRTSPETNWAQVGYGHLPECWYAWGCYFTAYRNVGASQVAKAWWQIASPLPYPTNNQFGVWQGAGGTHFGVNGFDFQVLGLNWGSTKSEWSGETHNLDDHFVGSSGLPVAFSGIRRLSSGTWYNVNPNQNSPGSDSPFGVYFSLVNSAFSMWDTRG